MVDFPDIDPALLPADGRFGCGPSKVRTDQLEALFTPLLMGTSHRAAPVRRVVADLKEGLRALLNVPDGYEVVLGNGGASAFWDAACACLISSRAAFGSWGAFGAKFAASAKRAPHLASPLIDEARAGSLVTLAPRDPEQGVDAYAYPHNETSTGVASPVYRVDAPGALTLVDGTSIRSTSPRSTPTTSPCKRPSDRTAASGSPSSPPPPSSGPAASRPPPAGAGSPHSCPCPPPSTTRARTKPSPRPRSRRSSWRSARSRGSTSAAAWRP